jgi:hypothetical protein
VSVRPDLLATKRAVSSCRDLRNGKPIEFKESDMQQTNLKRAMCGLFFAGWLLAGCGSGTEMDELPADELPADELPADELPADELPADELPADPNAPSNLSATWVNDGELFLQWTDNATDEQGFRIERKANGEEAFTQLVVTEVGTISYRDMTVGANGRYIYRVIAVRAAGDTGPSNEATGYTTPGAPSLAAMQTGADVVSLAWQDNAAYETEYRVERKKGAGPYALVTTLPAGAAAYTDSGLVLGNIYTWKVAAVAAGLHSYAEDSLTTVPASGPSWENPAQAGASLTNNGNGTVTDNQTGLTWQRQDDGTPKTWQEAIDYCAALSLGGSSNWRLPNRHELQSIVDYTTLNPAIDTAIFPGAASDGYWSSSTYAGSTYYAWHVSFAYGWVSYEDKTDYPYSVYARCVRP